MKFLLIFSLLFTYILAAPAFNKERDFKQADGTTFKAKAFGNQHLNWIETQDGEVLKYNQETNNFEYAHIKDEKLRASGARYNKNDSKKARALKKVKKIDKDELYKLWNKRMKESHDRKKHKQH